MKKRLHFGLTPFFVVLLWGCLLPSLWGQALTKRVLFLGNSYTDTNNLPGLIASAAQSTNDVLIHDSHTPGGFRFSDRFRAWRRWRFSPQMLMRRTKL